MYILISSTDSPAYLLWSWLRFPSEIEIQWRHQYIRKGVFRLQMIQCLNIDALVIFINSCSDDAYSILMLNLLQRSVSAAFDDVIVL